MTKKEKEKYEDVDELRRLLHKTFDGRKFRLDCGHHLTFGCFLGNNITIYNGCQIRIVCSECGY